MPRALIVGRAREVRRTEYAVKEAFKCLGFRVKVFDDVKVASWVGEALTNFLFRRALRRWRPDVVYFSKALHLYPKTIGYASGLCPTVMWYFDSCKIIDEQTLDRARRVTCFFTVSPRDVEDFRSKEIRAFHLPQAYYLPKTPSSLSRAEAASEVAFIGNNSGDEYRMKFLKFLGRKYELTVWGNGWEGLRGYCRVPNRRVFGEDYRIVCENTKILLGLHSFLGMRSRTGAVSNRLWNTLACGGFLLYQEVRGFQILKDGEHLVFFSGIVDARDKIDYYLSHEEERRRVSLEGQKAVLERHSYISRVKEMLKILSTL
ncbi:MAG TPA: hypothetical protein EYP17_01415 [Candidatus Latescibacteria bacterium]|nr:hypothetical protein [Candidatus Latescibacterota bacterium]